MTALSVRDGYARWAETYASENAVSQLEDALVRQMTPPLRGLRLLDAGCGTGRRLRDCGAATMTGVDLSPEMIAAGRAGLGAEVRTLVGDVRALPLPDASFDAIWCRLVIGHLPECATAYAELARVAAPGAVLIVSDFHPDAHAAGHRRTFRHKGVVHELEHHVHLPEDHRAAAARAGLRLLQIGEAAVGPEVRHFYEQTGRLDAYDAQQGLNVVLALAFAKDA